MTILPDVNVLIEEFTPLVQIKAKLNRNINGFDYDDIVQELYMVLLRCTQTFKPEMGFKFSTYFERACDNKLNKLRKVNKYTVPLNNVKYANVEWVDELEDKTDHIEKFFTDDLRNAVIEKLKEMPKGYVTLMYLVDEIPQTEIAELTGLSYSYVNKTHRKNIKKLSAIFSGK